VFLIGSALSVPAIPGVNEMQELIRQRLDLEPSQFGELMARHAGHPYQRAIEVLIGRAGVGACNQVVRDAVLQAYSDVPRGLSVEDLTRAEENLAAWQLPPGTRALGELVARFGEPFGRVVLTPNFDPLLRLAVRRAGAECVQITLDADGKLESVHTRACRIVHIHGYWLGTDCLHTPSQLSQHRPRLKASLTRLLGDSMLVVLGYGGWDDVLTDALAGIAADTAACPEVLWAFRGLDEVTLLQQNQQLFRRFGAMLGRGRFVPYLGIDAHRFLPRLVQELSQLAEARPEARLTPRASPSELPSRGERASLNNDLYRQRCKRRWGHVKLWGSVFDLLDRFVVPDCRAWEAAKAGGVGDDDDVDEDSSILDRLPILHAWPRLLEQPIDPAQRNAHRSERTPVTTVVSECGHLVLLGHAGAGKSALLQYLLLSLLDTEQQPAVPRLDALRGCLPLLVELNEAAGMPRHGRAHSGLLARWAADCEARGFVTDQQLAISRLRRGPSLLMFDGLDEIGDPRTRAAVVEEIIGMRGTLANARIVVTSRVADFDPAPFLAAGFRVVVLADFTEEQILRYLAKAAAARSPAVSAPREHPLVKRMSDTPHTWSLARNPLLLGLLEAFGDQDVGRTRGALYSRLVTRLAYEWDAERFVDTTLAVASAPGSRLADFPPQLHMDPVLRRIARAMLKAGAFDAGLTRDEVLEVLTGYCSALDGDTFGKQRAAKEFQDLLLSRTAIVRVYPETGRLRFAHRSFFEFLAARAIADDLERSSSSAASDAVVRLLTSPSGLQPGSELVQFTCPFLPSALVDRVLTQLCAAARSSEAEIECQSRPGMDILTAWQVAAELDAAALARLDDAPMAMLLALCGAWSSNPAWASSLVNAVGRVAPQSWPRMPAAVRAAWLNPSPWDGFEQTLVWRAVTRSIWAHDGVFVDELVTALRADPWRRRRRLLATVLAPLAESGVGNAVEALFAMAQADPHPHLRALACGALCRTPDRERAFQVLQQQSGTDAESEVRFSILRGLGLAFAEREATRLLLMKCATDESHEVRRVAAHELSHAYGRVAEVQAFLQQLLASETDAALKGSFERALEASEASGAARAAILAISKSPGANGSIERRHEALNAAIEADEDFREWSWSDDARISSRLMGRVFAAVAGAGVGMDVETLNEGGQLAVRVTEALVATAVIIVAMVPSDVTLTGDSGAFLHRTLSALPFAPWQRDTLVTVAAEERRQLESGPFSTCMRHVDQLLTADHSRGLVDAMHTSFGNSDALEHARALISL
jgi:hypothetical protein